MEYQYRQLFAVGIGMKGMSNKRLRGRPASEPASTRARLLSAAADVFNSDGYFGTDTNKIARAAQLAPATFYRHFRDKKHIFQEAYAHWVGADWQIIEKAIRDGHTPQERARAIVSAHSANHAKWVRFRLSMHALVAADPDVRAFHLKTRGKQLARLRQLLESVGAPRHKPGVLLASFLCAERLSNAVTDGELEPLGIPKAQVLTRIESEIVFQLTGRFSVAANES
jgi:AcrR family transcriptional regulator